MCHVRYYQVDLHSVPNGTGKKGRYSSVSTNILSLRDRTPISIAPHWGIVNIIWKYSDFKDRH
ncbi:MAG: hypothetical protein LBG80_02200 [Bacteroidales bacterium]|nr:hypothetical protein [Bacteroidales bacterium]